jgi:hypothetical protein
MYSPMTHLVRFAAIGAMVVCDVGAGPAVQKAHQGHGLDACAKACDDCQRACDSCATHCVRLIAAGKSDHVKSLQTCQDCADTCAAAARIVSRQGPFVDVICKACAEACARCAKACEQFPQDERMSQCAEECKKCEKACRDMLQHVAANP